MSTQQQLEVPQKPDQRVQNQESSPQLAAVAYLNMLPFFAGNSQFQLLSSPQSLNLNGSRFDAYCSSLIAGLQAGKTPLSSTLGVFSCGAVMSVFIEPVLHKESHEVFWQQLSKLWMHHHPSPIEALGNHEHHGTIVLRSSGESAQSIWMFEVLCALAGFNVEVLNEDAPGISPDPEKPLPEAKLFIGDKALLRRRNAPHALRLDLGELWTQHTGYKAWFAAWFAGQPQSANSVEKIETMLSKQVDEWSKASEFSRWCQCYSFLESNAKSLFNFGQTEDLQELRETLVDYFACLEHRIDAHEGQILLRFYLDVNNAFEAWSKTTPAQDTEKMSHTPVIVKSLQGHFAST